jgi:hypothetical protein
MGMFPLTDESEWCGEWQAMGLTKLSDNELARLWGIHKRFNHETEPWIAHHISQVREAINAGVTSEENVCRMFKCREGTKRWKIFAEIRSRLLGQWQSTETT